MKSHLVQGRGRYPFYDPMDEKIAEHDIRCFALIDPDGEVPTFFGKVADLESARLPGGGLSAFQLANMLQTTSSSRHPTYRDAQFFTIKKGARYEESEVIANPQHDNRFPLFTAQPSFHPLPVQIYLPPDQAEYLVAGELLPLDDKTMRPNIGEQLLAQEIERMRSEKASDSLAKTLATTALASSDSTEEYQEKNADGDWETKSRTRLSYDEQVEALKRSQAQLGREIASTPIPDEAVVQELERETASHNMALSSSLQGLADGNSEREYVTKDWATVVNQVHAEAGLADGQAQGFTDAQISGLAMAQASADEFEHQAGEPESYQDRLNHDLVMRYGPSRMTQSERVEDARLEREPFVAEIHEAAPPVFTPSDATEEEPDATIQPDQEVVSKMNVPVPSEEPEEFSTAEVAAVEEPEPVAQDALQEQALVEEADRQEQQLAQAEIESEQSRIAVQQEAAQQQEVHQSNEDFAFRLEEDRRKQQEADDQQKKQLQDDAARQAAENEPRIGFNDTAEPSNPVGWNDPEPVVGFQADAGGDILSNPPESMWDSQVEALPPGFSSSEGSLPPGFSGAGDDGPQDIFSSPPGADGFSPPGYSAIEESSPPGFSAPDAQLPQDMFSSPPGYSVSDAVPDATPGYSAVVEASSLGSGGLGGDETSASIGGLADGGGRAMETQSVSEPAILDAPSGFAPEPVQIASGGFSAPLESQPMDNWMSEPPDDGPSDHPTMLESSSAGGSWEQPIEAASTTSAAVVESVPEPVPVPPAPIPTPVMIPN